MNEEFGNERAISTSYIQKLNDWKPIKNEDGIAMRDLSVFLLSCNNMMSDVDYLNHLNSPTEIKKKRKNYRSKLEINGETEAKKLIMKTG